MTCGTMPSPTWRRSCPGCQVWARLRDFGSQYAMRVWINPDKLTNYHLTMEDVIMALRAYNVEVSAGQFGGAPAVEGQRLNAAIIVQHLLQTPEEFAAIPIRTNPDGSVVRVKDIGRTELGTERYDIVRQLQRQTRPPPWPSGRPPAPMPWIRPMPSRQKLEEMSRYFPPGMKVIYPYDTTPFTKVAIEEVVKTLFEAVLLVFVVMYLFHGKHPGHADPDHRGAGGAAGNLRGPGAFRVLHQHADHVRHGAGHRSAGG